MTFMRRIILSSGLTCIFGHFPEVVVKGKFLVLFGILLLSLIFLFHRYGLHLKKKYGVRLVVLIYVSFFFTIYFIGSLIRVYVFSHVDLDLTSFFPILLSVGGREVLPAPSGPGSSSSWREDSFELNVLLEPFSETEMDGSGTSVNQAGTALPANPVASRGEEAGPSTRIPPKATYPYLPDEIIGGDSVNVIHHRILLARSNFPTHEEIYFSRIEAEDLFEVKAEIIKIMSALDPTGDWMGCGARALDHPRTRTGESSLEQLYTLLDDLQRGGVESGAFSDLKGRMITQRPGDQDQSSAT